MPHPNERALMRYILRQRMLRQKQLLDAALRPGAAPRTDTPPDKPGDDAVQMTETRIYVGLNDAETRQQKLETGKYLDILKDVCRNYKVAFTVDIEEGGYYHEDGGYTEETSAPFSARRASW